MPLRRNPHKLNTISKWEIIQNLRKYTTKELQNLPNDLSEELIDFYNKVFLQNESEDKMKYYLRFIDRNRLIQPKIKKLNLLFPDQCKEFFHATLMMVLETCKNLTHFSCNFSKHSHQNLYQLVISIPQIIELKLNIGEPEEKYKDLEYDDDDILEAIGNYCFHLEILHLKDSRITDDGVRRFCQSNSAGAKIKELNLDDSCVDVKGCVTAVCNLKQLRRFYCCSLFGGVEEAFRKLFKLKRITGITNSNIPTFQLCELPTLSTDDIPSGFLKFVTSCCPNMRKLHLKVADDFDRHIKDLKSCNEDVCLHLEIDNVCNFMANLCYVGYRVTKLSLKKCKVHLPIIGFACPNLTDLTLCQVKYMPVNYVAGNNSVVAYSKLLELHLNSEDSSPIPEVQLQFLLENCLDLQTLKIDYNDEFTDDLMSRILHGDNPLRHLDHFELHCCNVVSSVAILQLLQADNKLTTLIIYDCENINSDNFKSVGGQCSVFNVKYIK